MKFYKSKEGESLYDIAFRFDIPVEYLIEANSTIENIKTSLKQTIILIPEIEKTKRSKHILSKYIVEKAQTISQISDLFGITVNSIIELNPFLLNKVLIDEGTVITVPNTNLFENIICSISDRNGHPELFCFYPEGKKPLNMNVCNIGWNSTPSMSPDKTKLCFHDINGLFKVIMLDKLEENIIYRNCHHSVYGLWSVSSDKILFEDFGDIFIYDVFEDRCNYIDCGTNPQWLGDCLNVIYLHKGKIIKYDVLTKEKKQIFFDEKEKCGLRAASDGSIISYFTTDTYDNDNVKKEITLNMLHVYSKEIVKTSNFGNVWPETGTWSTNSEYFSFWSPGQYVSSRVLSILKIVSRNCQIIYDIPAVIDPNFTRIAWSPDSRGLCFSASNFGGYGTLNIFGVTLAGQSTQITGTGNCVNPDWK